MELTEYGQSLFPDYTLRNDFENGQWELCITEGNHRCVLAVRAEEIKALIEMGIIKRNFPV